jgi:hypothetical protein
MRVAVLGTGALAAACGGEAVAPADPDQDVACSIPTDQIFVGQVKDGIPALTNPATVAVGEPGADFLTDRDRVVGLFIEGTPYAIPLNIFWYHEIVNLDGPGYSIAVTHCPLTGSSMAFDREPLGGVEFGVSGLLFRNNLIMYDRADPESLWPQMMSGARCGARIGERLVSVPIVETRWGGWKELHPDTRVVGDGGTPGLYVTYPYGDYDTPENPNLLFPGSTIDLRRPPKERVLGIPDGIGGIAFPFLGLASASSDFKTVVNAEVRGSAVVVFWDEQLRGAMAYRARSEGQALTFRVEEGEFVDELTESVWDFEGNATFGPATGAKLEPIAEAYVAFWFAWADFHPLAELWVP